MKRRRRSLRAGQALSRRKEERQCGQVRWWVSHMVWGLFSLLAVCWGDAWDVVNCFEDACVVG